MFSVAVALAALCSRHASAQFNAAHYLNLRADYPAGELNWSHDVQGVAHDNNNWYITNTEVIWKIPVTQDLRTVSVSTPGVVVRTFANYPQIGAYHHFGDPVVFRFSGADYLICPIENADSTCTSGVPGAAAIFRCADMSYVDHAPFPGQCNDAGWVAVDPTGVLVSSRQHVGTLNTSPPCASPGLRFYTFDWNLLHNSNLASMTFQREVHPLNEQGDCLEMATMQGGEFTPDGSLLYLLSGFHDDSNALADREGIHVLETSTYQRIAHSTRGFGYFDYYYDPGFNSAGEPEGLTIWDLDDGRAPGIRGQLHVMRLDNDALHDDVNFKHYTHVIRVSSANTTSCQFGTLSCPFNTFGAAHTLAWPGAEIRVLAGSYVGIPTITKRIRVTAEGGTVRLSH